ncbi:MAG: hypothetical protein NC548_39560 [Lachnospiraceae bacterium]|nr:hypothetical protein [Acetatifactor muris]MCM1220603.1 hypothetical protein [Lachnospiraceae bacterium]
MKTLNQSNCKLYSFLKAARGNWHNALFVKCTHSACPYGHSGICKGFLLIADADGTPLLADVETVRRLTHEEIEPEGCQGILNQRAFISAYSSYLEWHTEDDSLCPLRQLCQLCDHPC